MLSVNLTTTSERLDLCSATIWSLLNQKRVPDKIYLWISKNPYLADKGIKSLPSSIVKLQKLSTIFEIKFVDNIGPYRKIIPALKSAAQEDVIVYADDDVIYGDKWLYNLEKLFLDYDMKYVVASRIRVISKNIFGIKKSYNRYPLHFGNETLNSNFIITGVGGCILMKKHISEKLIHDDSFLHIAPKADDLWVSKIIEISGSKVKSCVDAFEQVQEINHSINCLSHANTLYFKGKSFSSKLYYRVVNFALGYLGIAQSANDKTLKRVSLYFENHNDIKF
ncbi:glycosyltransferase family 2 protein [Pluralibacter gergoviae]|uniref:glycosyltransferase n=1 Tax=Pluralibacter gergoviae TaxID=61647 RepID=UPI001909446F|nr:glycosyltransferase [Pluralibacter gergoviae]EKT9643560.1 glycosyltransferase family 2 protein [Pluralibacter gergoviae]EMD1656841.1 glycosyltransferase family 2 protein [Pluralibacter gergoviae]MBK4118575.1 glycosyltransferase family 2 protein [Pluralibacter gergoviae]